MQNQELVDTHDVDEILKDGNFHNSVEISTQLGIDIEKSRSLLMRVFTREKNVEKVVDRNTNTVYYRLKIESSPINWDELMINLTSDMLSVKILEKIYKENIVLIPILSKHLAHFHVTQRTLYNKAKKLENLGLIDIKSSNPKYLFPIKNIEENTLLLIKLITARWEK